MKKVSIIAIFFLVFFMFLSCNTGSSSDKDEQTTALPAPEGTTAWYRFENNVYGMALTGYTLSYDATSFEERWYYWDGDSWNMVMGLKGSLAPVSGSEYSATLSSIYMPKDDAFAWCDSSTEEFSYYRPHLWARAGNTARLSLSASGSTLTYKRDMTGDNAFDGATDYAKTFDNTASTTLTGHGKYPYVQYASWSFHGNADKASSSIQLFSLLDEAVDNSAESIVSSVTCRAKDQNGNEYGPFTYAWDGEDQDWGYTHTFTPVTAGSIWWLSEIVVKYKNGAEATYTANDPYTDYSAGYKTDTDFTGAIADGDFLPGQDYMPPSSAGSGSFKYFRTLLNAKSGVTRESYTDTKIYLYKASDTTKWVAVNDDWCDEAEFGDFTLYSTIKYPVQSGETYYLKVVDLNGESGGYSLIVQNNFDISAVLGTASSEAPASPDSHESDDVAADAETIDLNELQHHSLEQGDSDWVTITF